MIASILSLSIITPVSAQKNSNYENGNNFIYTYEYNGIEFTGDTELSEEELKSIYDDVMNTSVQSSLNEKNTGIGLFALDPGSTQVKVVPPYYRTYKNTGWKVASELITAYLISKMPKKVKGTAFGIWIAGKLQGWASNVKSTYVGSWVTSSWSPSANKRVYHATLVHYK